MKSKKLVSSSAGTPAQPRRARPRKLQPSEGFFYGQNPSQKGRNTWIVFRSRPFHVLTKEVDKRTARHLCLFLNRIKSGRPRPRICVSSIIFKKNSQIALAFCRRWQSKTS